MVDTGFGAAGRRWGAALNDSLVLSLEQVDETLLALVGGKGSHLAALSRIEGVRVPPGFCVTTDAFRRMLAQVPQIDDRLARLSRLDQDDSDAIGALSADIRRAVEGVSIPDEVAAAITHSLDLLGDDTAYAVRSSATAEDSTTASFAGQHDTYLDVSGPGAILQCVSRCWASLFTDRAVTYRLRNGIDHRQVQMAVVVQQMVPAEAAGVVFTADPVTSNRKVVVVEAVVGLGDALVSGRVNADIYKVCEGEVVEAVTAPEQQGQRALSKTQVVRLAEMSRRIEAHFGCPQDIEWCLADDGFQFVQSRPITPLFPIPAVADGQHHVYVSVGHQQMMTDAMKPLGLSLWQLTALRPMFAAGGRLFVDVTEALTSPSSRASLLEMFGRADPLLRDALATILARDDLVASLPETAPAPPPGGPPAQIESDPAIVTKLIERSAAAIAALQRDIRAMSGTALLDFIQADIQELKRFLADPQSMQVIMAAMDATWWLNERLYEWLGEKNAADTLTRSAPGNVTSEMGLALLDVADVVRSHPDVVTFLHHVEDDDFLDALAPLDGGQEVHDAIRAYLDTYGMRCVGEIDITRPRWRERPTTLVPVILDNVRTFEPGARERLVERGRRESRAKEQELLQRLRALPDGERKAEEVRRMIDRLRTFIGYREYPKYAIVSRFFVYKQALLDEADRLVQALVLREAEDLFFLTVQELHDAVRTRRVDHELIRRRKDELRSYQALTPPRVLTSDGEMLNGAYRRDDLPAGALAGLAVSAGTVEGRARVVLDIAQADLEPGDILVTRFTDPSWSPLFLSAAGLVTEVGGLMTHGAVIAREYGLPAVVGVADATRLIRDGQRVRVDGTHGYVEVLAPPSWTIDAPGGVSTRP